MALVSVVEAAGLSGLPPDAIRALISTGSLQAVAVPIGCGPAYLVESEQLELLERSASERRGRLVEALAGLQAAIGRRRVAAEARLEADDDEGPRPAARACGGVGGLGAVELRSLAGLVERLLGP